MYISRIKFFALPELGKDEYRTVKNNTGSYTEGRRDTTHEFAFESKTRAKNGDVNRER